MLKRSLGGGVGSVEMKRCYDPVRAHVCAGRWIDLWIQLFRRKDDAVFHGGCCHPYDLLNQYCASVAQ